MQTSIVVHWRSKAARYQLAGQVCPDCQQTSFPPRRACLDCRTVAQTQIVSAEDGIASPSTQAPFGAPHLSPLA